MTAQIEQLANQARQLAAIGQLQAARARWVAVLDLLPNDVPERQGVLREIQRIDGRLAPKPAVTWTKRLGPFGVIIAALAKFKTVALLLLTKGKFLFSVLAFVGFYWALFGWWFAVGLAGSVLLHEMGHYVMVRRFGFKAELPMFLPGLGAYVKWQGANVDAGVRAQISLAGPFFGFLSGLIAYGIFLNTNQGVWLAVAQFAGWLNLINLIPVSIFDGGAAMNALGRQHRLALLLVCVVLGFLLHEYAFLFVAAGTGYRIYKRDFPAEPYQGVAYSFVTLVVANGLLSWFCSNQARVLFAQHG
ncbi:MAG TPA: site-2 protease family protein [Bryobacteraceae bacterium]|nr:site-2 protease family protein [Bryobacteraceae bacterium]